MIHIIFLFLFLANIAFAESKPQKQLSKINRIDESKSYLSPKSLSMIYSGRYDLSGVDAVNPYLGKTTAVNFNNWQVGYSYRMRGFTPYISYTFTTNGNTPVSTYSKASAGFMLWLF
jgi:hypothetical protein